MDTNLVGGDGSTLTVRTRVPLPPLDLGFFVIQDFPSWVVYVNGIWFLQSTYIPHLWTSTDGLTFSSGTVSGIDDSLSPVRVRPVYGSGMWMIAQYVNDLPGPDGYGTEVYTSLDGYSWTLTATLVGVIGRALAFGDGKFVLVGGFTGHIQYSSDGVTWTSVESDIPVGYGYNLYDVEWNGSIFMATASTGYITTSPDGVDWTDYHVVPFAGNYMNLAYSPTLDIWVLATSNYLNHQIATSSDAGVTWVERASPYDTVGDEDFPDYGGVSDIVWDPDNDIFVVVGFFYTASEETQSDRSAFSSDGITWTEIVIPGTRHTVDPEDGSGLVSVSTDGSGNNRAAGLVYLVELTEVDLGSSSPAVLTLSTPAPALAILHTSKLIINDDQSTAPHGLYLEVELLENVSTVSVFDPNDPTWSFDITPHGGFLEGDLLSISSEYNQKYVYLKRGSTYISLADAVIPGSVWPLLFPGENKFEWHPEYIKWSQVWHYPAYWGV